MDNIKKMTFDIPEDLHRKLKTVASLRNCTVRNYIINHIKKYVEADIKQFTDNNEIPHSIENQ